MAFITLTRLHLEFYAEKRARQDVVKAASFYDRTEQLANPIHHISMQLSNLNAVSSRHFYNSRPVSAAAPELLSTSSHAASASA